MFFVLNLNNIINSNSFNLFNTFIYGFLVIFFYFLSFRIFKKFIVIDHNFIYSTIPFLFIGAVLRIFSQPYTSLHLLNTSTNFLDIGFYFRTPGFLILCALIYISFLIISIFFSKLTKLPYYKILSFYSSVIIIIFLFFIISNLQNYLFIYPILASFLLYLFILFLFKNRSLFNNSINKLVLFSQIFDSFITISGLYFFSNILYEKHFFSRFIISISPLLFVLLKVLLVIIFIYLVDKYIVDTQYNLYFKLFVIILGLLISFRGLLTIALL